MSNDNLIYDLRHDDYGDAGNCIMSQAADRIEQQQKEIEMLHLENRKAMRVIDKVVQKALKPSNIYAEDLIVWLLKEEFLKIVPFDPKKHYDYTNETKEGQNWIDLSDWYATLKGK